MSDLNSVFKFKFKTKQKHFFTFQHFLCSSLLRALQNKLGFLAVSNFSGLCNTCSLDQEPTHTGRCMSTLRTLGLIKYNVVLPLTVIRLNLNIKLQPISIEKLDSYLCCFQFQILIKFSCVFILCLLPLLVLQNKLDYFSLTNVFQASLIFAVQGRSLSTGQGHRTHYKHQEILKGLYHCPPI